MALASTTIPIEGLPRRSAQSGAGGRLAVAVEQVAVPLTESEIEICTTLHCPPEDYVAARARRRRGGSPLESSPLGQRIVGASDASSFITRGFSERK